MEQKTFIESLKVVFALRFKESASFFKFLIVGIAGMVVDLTFSNLLRISEIAPNIAATIAAALAMLTTFTLNNIWSFNKNKIVGYTKVMKKFIPYALLSTVPIVVRFFLVGFMVGAFGNTLIIYNLALFIAIGLGILWNYFSYKKFIWADKKEDPKKPTEDPKDKKPATISEQELEAKKAEILANM